MKNDYKFNKKKSHSFMYLKPLVGLILVNENYVYGYENKKSQVQGRSVLLRGTRKKLIKKYQ